MRNLVIHIAFLLFSTLAISQVSTQVDTTNIRIGEQFHYELSIENVPNVQFPKLQLDSLGKLEIVHSLPIDTLKKRLYKKYILTSFDSGSYRIPAQEIYINNRRFLTDSLLIHVGTVAVDTAKQKLFPIKSIYKAPEKTWHDYLKYLWWLLAALTVIGLIWWFISHRKKTIQKRAMPVLSPIEEALGQFQILDNKQLIEQQKIKTYYIELTEIVRDYIGKDVHIPTMEVTTEELVTLLTIHNKSNKIGIDKERITELHQFLQTADLVKFAKSKPELTQIQEDRKMAESLINTIQSEVHKPVLDEFGEEIVEETPAEIEKKSSKKRRLIGIIIGVVLGFIISISVISYYGYTYVKDSFIGHPTKELLEGDWYHSSYGYPAVGIETPKILKSQAIEIPEQAKQMLLSNSTFVYGSIISGFYIMVNTTEYNPQVEFSLDNAVSGAIQMIESQPEVSNLEHEVEDIEVGGKKGKVIKGTFITKENKMQYTQYLFEGDKTLQQIVISRKTKDLYAKDIQERIEKSIQLEKISDDNSK